MKVYSFLKNIIIYLFYKDDNIPFWNHNSNYYRWINEQLKEKVNIIDVGCRDWTLVKYLNNGKRNIIGIDISQICNNKANENIKK